jgi:hypothetical protein
MEKSEMTLIYVGSVRAFAGKNLFSLGLARNLINQGLSLAVMKPYGANPQAIDDTYTDGDAWIMNETLELGQTPDQCCPVVRTQDLVAKALRGHTEDYMAKIKAAYQEVGQGKDAVMLCGAGTLRSGAMVGVGGYKLALESGAKVIIIDRYENDFFLDDLLSAAYRLKDNLAGVVINAVDQEMNAALTEQVTPFLAKQGIKVLGVLPKDELLSSVSVRVLAEILGAKPLTGFSHTDRMIKRFFIGAMQVGHASRFFGGARDFACLVGGDRPDMQIAAIEGGAACLILTGNFYPSEIIISRAEDHDVPVMVVREDTFAVSRNLEFAGMRDSLSQPEKIKRATELVKEGMDFDALFKALGIKPKK